MNERENMSKILSELHLEKKIPRKQDLGLNNWEYGDLLDSMIEGKLISGEKSQRGSTMGQEKNSSNDDRIVLGFGSYKIEIVGMEYLEKNPV